MEKGESLLVRGVLIGFVSLLAMLVVVWGIPTFGSNWGNVINISEDVLFTYNLSANVTDLVPEVWTFRLENITGNPNITTIAGYYWVSLNTNTGLLTINATRNNETGFLNMSIFVGNPNDGEARPFYFNVSPVNDAPYFTNLANLSFNMSQLFSHTFYVSDEEIDPPYKVNISFLSCESAEWWNYSVNGCLLFNSTQYSVNSTSGATDLIFTPGKNNVGSYIINFSAADSGTDNPVNASSSQVVNFTVLDVNSAPVYTNICGYNSGDIYINLTEEDNYGCYFNVSDIGENKNISFSFTNLSGFSSDLGWFANVTTKATNLSVNYTAFVYINVTPEVRNVGNWSINITAFDSGAPRNLGSLGNSTSIRFYVGYTNHSVALNSLSGVSLSSGPGAPLFLFYVNASDNDLLIPDKSVYNENLSFNVTLNGLAVNWTNIVSTQQISGTNVTSVGIRINSSRQVAGVYNVNVSVWDSNRNSSASSNFSLTIRENDVPIWGTLLTNLVYWEGNNTYLNLSQNVSDPQNDAITFSYSSDTSFPHFSINSTTGLINFTSNNQDVGQHIVTITATDSLLESSSQTLNFTIYNVDDTPNFVKPLTSVNTEKNASINTSTNTITVQEDHISMISVQAVDSDLQIPQKSFYNESLNLSVIGMNSSLLNFTYDGSNGNKSFYHATFTPLQQDIGVYNVTLLISDRSGLNDTLSFNLSVLIYNRPPVLVTPATNDYVYSVDEGIFLDLNSTDREDLNESTGNLIYSIQNLSSANFLSINNLTGIINLTFNDSYAGGPWRFNVSVNDSGGATDSWTFNLTVYDYPKIYSPVSGINFSFVEDESEVIVFNVSHIVGNNLNYSVYLDNVLRNFTSGSGDGGNFSIYLQTNYTDEKCGNLINLSLNVSNVKLSNFSVWNLSIANVDEPLTLYQNISNVIGGSSVILNLSNYYRDADASDPCYNQSIVFFVNPVGINGISYSVSNGWTGSSKPSVTFTSSESRIGNFSIIGYEYNVSNSSQILRTVQSNNFSVQHIVSTVSDVTQSSGGGSVQKIVAIKIILPGPISTGVGGKIVLPIEINNPSKVSLSGIKLTANVAKDGVARNDFELSFDNSYIQSLSPGQSTDVNLSVNVGAKELGTYELTVYANVSTPSYSDWGKVYISIEEGTKIQEKILFTEKLVVENPECLELKEMVEEAKKAYSAGDYNLAREKIDAATEACKKSLAQKSSFSAVDRFVNMGIVYYVLIACGAALVIGLVYYYYRRYSLMKVMRGY